MASRLRKESATILLFGKNEKMKKWEGICSVARLELVGGWAGTHTALGVQ